MFWPEARSGTRHIQGADGMNFRQTEQPVSPAPQPIVEHKPEVLGRRILIIVENLPVPFDRRVWLEAQTLRDAGAYSG